MQKSTQSRQPLELNIFRKIISKISKTQLRLALESMLKHHTHKATKILLRVGEDKVLS